MGRNRHVVEGARDSETNCLVGSNTIIITALERGSFRTRAGAGSAEVAKAAIDLLKKQGGYLRK